MTFKTKEGVCESCGKPNGWALLSDEWKYVCSPCLDNPSVALSSGMGGSPYRVWMRDDIHPNAIDDDD